MKYLKTFETYSYLKDYFIKIFNEMYKDILPQEVLKEKDNIKKSLINRAKINMDNSPSSDKLLNWENEIDQLLDNYIQKGHFKSDEELEDERKNEIKKYNLKYLTTIPEAIQEIKEFAKYCLYEVGIDSIIKFLKVEDGMNFILKHSSSNVNFSKDEPQREDEDIVSYIKRKSENRYTWNDIENRLTYYYLRRVAANVPYDKKFENIEEAIKFLKVYTQKFIYGYLLPMSEKA